MPFLLALAALIAPDPDTAAAQARLRAFAESPRGISAAVAVASDPDPCLTIVTTDWGGPAPAAITRIDWRRAQYVRFQDNDPDDANALSSWVEIAHPLGYWQLNPVRARVAPILAAARDLIRLCATPDATAAPPAPPPPEPAPADIGARRSLSPLVPGDTKTLRCLYAAAPELILEYDKRKDFRHARYEARPRMLAFDINSFSVDFYPPNNTPDDWRGTAVTPMFDLGSPMHRKVKIASATLSLDGKPLTFPLRVRHDEDLLERGGLGTYVAAMLAEPSDAPAFLQALAAGALVELRLYGEDGAWIDRWDYEVTTLRHAPAALAASNWSCNGAR